MIKGLYTSAMGMLLQEAELNVTTNNLANVNTTGYKKDKITFEAFPTYLQRRLNDTKMEPGQKFYVPPDVGKLGTGAILDRVTTVHEMGSLEETENPTDLAVTGKAYFAIQTEQGVRFTKDGRFQINEDGYLITRSGDRVLGFQGGAPASLSTIMNESGPTTGMVPIRVDNASSFHIDDNGEVWQNHEATGQRLIKAAFENTNQIQKEGNSRYRLIEGNAVYDGTNTIKQGFLEASNINIVSEMVNLIKVSRAYESNSKILTGIDERLGQAVREVGQLR
jgi:flagellar basal-body rod protein FlgG